MKRREVILLLGGAALAGLPGTRALAQPTKIYRIGILSVLRRSSESVFREAMRDLGYVEGKNVVYEARYSGRADRLAETPAELVRAHPHIIVPARGPASPARPAGAATSPLAPWSGAQSPGTSLVVY